MSAQLDAVPLFRPMREEDLDHVMLTESRAYQSPWTRGIFRDCLRASYSCWVMEVEGAIRGHGVLSVAVGETHILNVCIDPELQGQGYGRSLLLHLLELSTDYGAKMALLEVRPSNQAAVRLYESVGFSEVGRRKDYYPGGPDGGPGREDALVMALGLGEPDADVPGED